MKFYYRARTKEGRIQSGVIEAFSKKGALDVLEKYGFYVTALKEAGRVTFFQQKIFAKKPSIKDIVIFTRQLSVMLKSSIPPVESLRTQVIQAENSDFREAILKIAEMVETGSSLSQAFSSHPKIFNTFYVSCVKSGEASGKVADSLDYLAQHLESEYELQSKIKGAMLYPIMVIMVALGVTALIIFFIIPRLMDVLEDLAQELPFSTRVMMSFSNFVREGGWILILIFFVGLIVLFQYFRRSQEGKDFWDKASLKIPLFGDFYKKIYLTRFAENLSVLIAAGLPITQALKITADVIDNSFYKKIIEKTEERVARGETISSVLSRYPEQVPSFLTQMVFTGEETGRLENTLMDVVNFYKGDLDRFINNLTKILEPMLMLFLGGLVGTLVISIFIPLFQIGLGGTGAM
jgi:type IV pilus assembly protein PilC